jgi:hypothetical protein
MNSDWKLLGCLYLLGFIWVGINYAFDLHLTVCPTKLVWHVPCPGCGLTRASSLLLEGNFADAIKMNPNIIIVAPAAILFPIVYVVLFHMKRKNMDLSFPKLPKQIQSILLCTLLVAELFVWGYNIYNGN